MGCTQGGLVGSHIRGMARTSIMRVRASIGEAMASIMRARINNIVLESDLAKGPHFMENS